MNEIIGIDHIYITVSDMARSEEFYDHAMKVLGFRKKPFSLNGEPHIHYFNRHFGYVLRPARNSGLHDPYGAGLHHLCLRVDSVDEVVSISRNLRAAGIEATEASRHSEYALDYWATYFLDPDGVRLEVTNFRQERRERHDDWNEFPGE